MGQSIIEINGKKYDATTGLEVTSTQSTATVRTSNGAHLDGIVNGTPSTVPTSKPVVTIVPKSNHSTPAHRNINDISAVHGNRVKRSKTLMRNVVKKPGAKPVTSVNHTTHPLVHSSSYSTAQSADKRLRKAETIRTHEQIQHFSTKNIAPNPLKPTVVQSMPVKAQPAPAPSNHPIVAHKPQAPQTSLSNQFVDSQLAKASSVEQVPQLTKKPLHKRVTHSMKSHKIRSVAVSSLAALLIAGFLAYQNMPTITLAMANREAGISAKMPEGIPSNFALSRNISKTKGQVTLTYKSRVDDRSFILTQLKSDITTASLKQKIAEDSKNQYQTYEAGGITLYLSGSNKADWIDGGMRYNITGNTGLSPDQLAVIASSL